MQKSALHRSPQNPPPRGGPDPNSEASCPFLGLPGCTFGDFAGLRGASFPRLGHYPTVPGGEPSTVLHPLLHFKEVPPRDLPVPGRLPARGVGRGPCRSPRGGSPRAEATHVSRRIFLSATTSPVSLFLALYTTPYVPSPIFSTFWKFSMKRSSESGQPGPGAGAWEPCRKRTPVLRGGGGGSRARHGGSRSGWNAGLPLALVNLSNLKQCCRLPPVPHRRRRPRLSFPRFPGPAPGPSYWPTSERGAEPRAPRS